MGVMGLTDLSQISREHVVVPGDVLWQK